MNDYVRIEILFDDLVFSIKEMILNNYRKISLKKTTKILQRLIKKTNKITNFNNKNDKVVVSFNEYLCEVITSLKSDLIYFYESDPAATDLKEIVLTYPGYYAIIVYRIAHLLNNMNIKYLPRMLSEYAHSKTGIDIHPNANIGNYFFIDHGTGIVIGETTVIGHHFKIYQNVTLGALSLREGKNLKGTKRHPTIGNYVTIYAGATILGGNTIIDDNTTIGSNAFVIKSILTQDE
jgi:serine O-acetyltransferase